MKQWLHSIGARIFAGFGLFILALAVFFILTARTTRDQANLLDQSLKWDQSKAEVSKLLQRVEAMRAYALLAARLPEPSHLPRRCPPVPRPSAVRLCHQIGSPPARGTPSSRSPMKGCSSTTSPPMRLLDALQGLVPPGTRKAELEVDFDRLWKVDELSGQPLCPGVRPDFKAGLPGNRPGHIGGLLFRICRCHR